MSDAPTLTEQLTELELVYLERRDSVIMLGERVKAGRMLLEEFNKRKSRLPALMAARDTLRNLVKEAGEQAQ